MSGATPTTVGAEAQTIELKPRLTYEAANNSYTATGPALYPHLYDTSSPTDSSLALSHIGMAGSYVNAAIDSFQEGQLVDLESQLALAAVSLKEAHKNANFNSAFSGAVSFARRATFSLDASDATLDQLICLKAALRRIHDEPLMSLTRSAELVIEMEEGGLRGEVPEIEAIIGMLLAEGISDAKQQELALQKLEA